jgi:hypothetical protein
MSKAAEVQRLARAAAHRAISDTYALESFKIVKFGRHRNGYLHAQVSVNGETAYVHRRWGSWQLPIPNDNPYSPYAREVLSPFREALEDEAAPFDARRHRELAAAKEAAKRKEGRDAKREGSDGPKEHDEAGSDVPVPD